MTEILIRNLSKIQYWLITTLPQFLIIILLGFIGFKALSILSENIKKIALKNAKYLKKKDSSEYEKRVNTLTAILKTTGKILIWALLIMTTLKKIGIDIAPLIAGAGIAGVAIGFGAQELVRDIISGFFLLLENDIRNGDVVTINGTGGLVESIGIRTIHLRDLAGIVHVFQNGKIDSLSNMTKEWSAMIFDIGIAYKENVDDVIDVMKDVSKELQNSPEFKHKILEEIEIFGLDKFANSAVIIKARLKTKPIEQWAVGREYNRRLKIAFDEKGIEIPFPHQTIYWGDNQKPFESLINK